MAANHSPDGGSNQRSPDEGKRIEDYGLIGNMMSAALVGYRWLDRLAVPAAVRFEACFAALLGTPENGCWRIAPRDQGARSTRRYLPDTAVLETRFDTDGGSVTVTDFMPFTEDEEKVDIVRIVTGLSGEVEVDMELTLRFGYGQAVPWVRRRDYGLSAIAGPDAVELHTPGAARRREHEDGGALLRPRGRERAVHALLSPLAPTAAVRSRPA